MIRIVSVAFKMPGGMIFSMPPPARHIDLLQWMRKLHGDGVWVRDNWSDFDQGFLTSDGVYVARRHAMEIAVESGQVERESTINGAQLFSEDLW